MSSYLAGCNDAGSSSSGDVGTELLGNEDNAKSDFSKADHFRKRDIAAAEFD